MSGGDEAVKHNLIFAVLVTDYGVLLRGSCMRQERSGEGGENKIDNSRCVLAVYMICDIDAVSVRNASHFKMRNRVPIKVVQRPGTGPRS